MLEMERLYIADSPDEEEEGATGAARIQRARGRAGSTQPHKRATKAAGPSRLRRTAGILRGQQRYSLS
jgi:hypothetical protein